MKPFHFKQFSVQHHNSTMKVGTDAILLSVWADIKNVKTALDIGTGCGVIALIIASRTTTMVDAVELDKGSSEEASENFTKSIYKSQLKVYNSDFNSFAKTIGKKYDLIISNPPFFSDSLGSKDPSRNNARHIVTLSHENLCKGIESLLSNNGRSYIVLPTESANKFINTANYYGLYMTRKQLVFPKENMSPNRVNIEFGIEKPKEVIVEKMIIRDFDNSHTDQYRQLVSTYLTNI